MKKISFVPPHSFFIFVVIFSACVTCMITSQVIKKNLIQYSGIKKELKVKVPDRHHVKNKDSLLFVFPVHSKLPIDSVKPAGNSGISKKSQKVFRHTLFHENPSFLVWNILILIMVTIAGGAFPVFIVQIFQMRKKFELSKWQLFTSVFCAVCIAVLLHFTNSETPGYNKPSDVLDYFDILLKDGTLLNKIVDASLFLTFPSFIVIFIVGIASDNVKLDSNLPKIPVDKEGKITNHQHLKTHKEAVQKIVLQFEFLNQTLKGALQILAIIVVFTVLTSSALGESIKASLDIRYFDIFPKEVSYVYGMYFSLFLCIIYIPSYLFLKMKFNRFKQSLLHLNEISSESWLEPTLNRVKLETSVFDNLKIALTVLAPLLSSFLPNSFNLFK